MIYYQEGKYTDGRYLKNPLNKSSQGNIAYKSFQCFSFKDRKNMISLNQK